MRRCALSPRAFLLNVGLLAAANLAIGIAFGCVGYPLVTACCGVQAVGLDAAALFYGLHAVDGEELDLARDTLDVKIHRGLTTRVARLDPRWTRLEQRGGALHLCSGRSRLEVGRHLTAMERRRFASEFNRALGLLR
ncbi:MAG: Protein of unknown function transrane [Variovorax sp.]|nr:Protein of unknown function transrane [Variovorax sp.]